MNFEFALMEAEGDLLLEAGMTSKQRRAVTKLGRSGWDIKKRDDEKVVMTKRDDEVFVYSSGETYFLNEGKEMDVTAILDALEEDEQ